MEVQRLRVQVATCKANIERLQNENPDGDDEEERRELGGDAERRFNVREGAQMLHYLMQFDTSFLDQVCPAVLFVNGVAQVVACRSDLETSTLEHAAPRLGDDAGTAVRRRVTSGLTKIDAIRGERPLHTLVLDLLRENAKLRLTVVDYDEGLRQSRVSSVLTWPTPSSGTRAGTGYCPFPRPSDVHVI